MISFFMTLLRFLRAFYRGLSDPEFRAMFVVLATLIVSGTVFYSSVEGWTVVDALYFCVMTLATVGYGDLAPTTDLSKIFTILYVMVGVGVFVSFITKLSARQHKDRDPELSQKPESSGKT